MCIYQCKAKEMTKKDKCISEMERIFKDRFQKQEENLYNVMKNDIESFKERYLCQKVQLEEQLERKDNEIKSLLELLKEREEKEALNMQPLAASLEALQVSSEVLINFCLFTNVILVYLLKCILF